jgi:DNA-directed RNA polymerase subunit RPC12/RpoP
MQKNEGVCPNCEATITFKKPPSMGQRVACRQCGRKMVVVRRHPVIMDLAEEESYEQRNRRNERRQKRQNRRNEPAW